MISREYIAIEDLVETIIDNRGKTVPIIDGSGIPLIATNCIKFSSIYPVFENIRYISQDTYDTWFRAHLEPNDILFVNKGTPGRCCITPDPVNFVGAQDMVGLRFRKEYHPFYMLAVIRSKEIQETIQNNHVGLVIAHFRKQELVKLKLPILNKNIRDYIGEIYKNISFKIELNNKINAELEAMAKTLYDYWFVQFDFPNKDGKPYKSSGGKMVWNEELKREIPEGWEVRTLLDIATFTNGLACQKFRPKENEDYYQVIKIREMGSGFSENSEFVSSNIPEKVIVYNGDILFSWSATLDVKIWTGGTGGLNQHIFKVTSKKYPKSYYYFELLNYLQHFKMMAELRKTTMGHITQEHLKESRITIPPTDLINKLDEIIKPILVKKVKLEEENQELASLRDWLLPMLMNGQVSVGDVEEQLGMVAESEENYKRS